MEPRTTDSDQDPASQAPTNGAQSTSFAPPPKRRGPPVIILLPVVLACVIVPYLFWQGTWFGKPLPDAEIKVRLDAIQAERSPTKAQLRQAQHAMEQISKRLATRGKSRPTELYPRIVALAEHPEPVIRRTVAWLMQEDQEEESFDAPLRKLVVDGDPNVRRNAALALLRRRDTASLPVLRAMLVPYDIKAPAAGKVVVVVDSGARLRDGNEIARVESEGGVIHNVRAPMKGKVVAVRVTAGMEVTKDAVLCALEPSNQHVRYALFGMAGLGTKEDVKLIEPYLQQREGYDKRVPKAAQVALDAIAKRVQ